MPVDKCILDKAKRGLLSQAKAEELANLYRRQLGEGSPAHRAALDALEIARKRTQQTKRQGLLAAQKQITIGKRIADADPKHKNAAGKSFLHFDETGRFGGDNVASQHEVVRGLIHARMAGAIEKLRSKALGAKKAGTNKASLRAIVREMFGEASGDAEAKVLARGVNDALDFGRRMFNDAGGDLPSRGIGVGQIHSRAAFETVTKDEWILETLPRLDRARMVDIATGRAMTNDQVMKTLGEVYDEVVSVGLSEIKDGKISRNIGTTRQERNSLPFRDADAWLAYHEKFGTGNAYEAIMANIDGMARDIALMRVLGPNPDATVQFIKRNIEAGGVQAGSSIDNLYGQVSGSALQVENQVFADVMGTVRAWQVATILGQAFISALSDTVFSGLTAGFNGFSGTRTIAGLLKTFSTASKADRLAALRAGHAVDTWTTTLAAQQRFSADALGHQAARQVADVVLRASFLSSWTEAGKIAFQREFLSHLTNQASKAFGDVPGHVRRSFQRHGITEADWNIVRKSISKESTGLERLDIAALAENPATRDTAIRLNSMILNESKFAVPEATAKTRALLTQGTKAGSVMGEVARTGTLFKTFPVAILQTHIFGRLIGDVHLNVRDRLAYGSNLIIGTTMMGALSLQLKEIARGKDPRPMTDANFWMAALVQGGSLGLLGDLLLTDHNQFGGGAAQFVAGPVVGQIDKALKLTGGNIAELVEDGKAKNLPMELLLFGRSMMPGQNLWFTRLAFERAIMDNLARAADPNVNKRFQRIQKKARQQGQGFFSPPGKGIERAPNLENVFRKEP